MKKLWIYFGLGLLAGTVITNLLKVSFIQGIWDYQISLGAIDSWELFFYIWQKRSVVLLVLWLLSFTIFCYPVIYGYAAYYGFSVSVVISVLTMEQGIKSIFLYFGMCFPQMLIYVPVWIAFVYLCMKENGKMRQIDHWGKQKRNVIKVMKWGTVLLAAFLLFTVGAALEAFLNPYIISKCLAFL